MTSTELARTTEDRTAELRALGRLAAEELSNGVGGIGGLHRGIAERVFWGVEKGVGPAASATRRGGLALGIVQGLRGDTLEREENPLAQPMAVRVEGHPVAPRRDDLARAFPSAGPRLVVF